MISPAETVCVAPAACPKGSLAIRLRDELGVPYRDEEFTNLFPTRGKPAWSPGRLARSWCCSSSRDSPTGRPLRQGARIDFKYALGMELADPGFDFSMLSEFRDRLAGADGGRRVMDGILTAVRDRRLLTSGG
ncbi:transposase [Streptomyces sp. CA-135486]|uniref:transposase n=1 Tax=Streptomyces sp. CA-135486 TaxID=3240049 RepID=UPI003D93041C